MKTIRYLFCVILLLSYIEVQGGDYSIDSFLDYLQETGYYDIMQSIKLYFGDDVAIDICQELVHSNDCETIVRVYMTSGSGSGPNHAPAHNNPDPDYELIEKLLEYIIKKFKIKDKKLIELIRLIISFYSVLKKEMKKGKEILAFIERILKNGKLMKHLSQFEENK